MYGFDIKKPVIGSASTEINKPVAQVFTFVADHFFDNYPKWALEVVDFKPLSKTCSVGAMAHQTRFDQGQKIESTFAISAYEQNQLLVIDGLSEAFRNSFQFEGTENKTILTERFELLEIELFMRPFEKLLRTAIEEGLQNSVANIKKLLE